MGLSLLNALPDPHSQMESMRRALAEITAQRDQLRIELQEERNRSAAMERGAQELRTVLNPLYSALRHIFGELDDIGPGQAAEPPASTRANAVWESWKGKLGGKAAEAIDALLIHGEMNAQQLRIHLHCGRDYVYQVVHQLNKASLINKNGGKISLKEL